MTEPVLLNEVRDGVVMATMNRPHVLNALNTELRRELVAFWRRFRDDPALRVAIITGAGPRAFSTGRDLKETAAADSSGGRVNYEDTGEWGYPNNFALGKPVIAAVHGFCMAAGLMVAIGSDIRICSEQAVFANPQVRRGRGTRMPYFLVQAGLPRAVVMDMVMSGEPLTAEQALRWGLVSRVVPKDRLLDTAWEIGARLANNSPVVISAIKRAAEAGLLDLPQNEALKLWDPFTGMMSNTADAIEGARSFAEKRDASFSIAPVNKAEQLSPDPKG